METASDEDIIKRKLIVEGDSGNDDKRMVMLLKSFMRFSQLEPSSDKKIDGYNNVICIMQQCKQAMIHNLFVYQANNEQQKMYTGQSDSIAKKIEVAQKKIVVCQENLVKAKQIRKNRMEYNNLAKIVLQHPSRDQSTLRLKEVHHKLALLQSENESMDKKIEMRRKQFRLFLVALKDLKKEILDKDSVNIVKSDNDVEMMEIS